MSVRHDLMDAAIEHSALVATPPRRSVPTGRTYALPGLTSLLVLLLALYERSLWLAAAGAGGFAVAAAISFAVGRVGPPDTVVLVGRTPLAAIIASAFAEQTRLGARTPRVLRAMNLGEAAALVRTARCAEVIVAGKVSPRWPELVDARGRRPAVVGGADVIERVLGRVPLELVAEDRWLTRLGRIRPLRGGYAAAKRGLDLAVALALGIAVLPALPLIALAIRLDSAGPIFYSQQRVGLGGRVFRIYKFRTMRQDAERFGAVWATERDPRVTRVGRLMRLTRIDELPQIWNVLRGDMTLVGPRPERPEFTTMLAQEIPGYDKRHAVKPGLTGWAQVCYRYTSSVRDTMAKVEYDLYYIKNASLRLDLKILLKTVVVVLTARGR